ncbi:mucin-2-like isoform X2 [Ostrea edulis]|nr:mucin-2-like isoform X2 [Ostrea edulis]XP_056011340.1 mucin-2-like isoform X2 [Ostrea edulis]
MWWGAAVYIVMLGCVRGVSGSKDNTTFSIPTLSPGSATPLVTTTSPTVDFTSMLSPSRDNSSISSPSKKTAPSGTLSPVLTPANVTKSERFSFTFEMSASGYNSLLITLTPDRPVSTEQLSSSVTSETFLTSRQFSSIPSFSTQTAIATSDFSENLKTSDSYSTTISKVPLISNSDFTLTESSSTSNSDFRLMESSSISNSDFSLIESSSSISNSDFRLMESSSISNSDFSLIESSSSISNSDFRLMESSSISNSDFGLMEGSSISNSDFRLMESSSISNSDFTLIESSSISNSEFSLIERSSHYQSVSAIETTSVRTPPLPPGTDNSMTISSSALPSSATSRVATSPTDSEKVPSTQFPITHSSSASYPSTDSSIATSLFPSHVFITAEMQTGSALPSFAIFSSTLAPISFPAYPPSSQIIGAVTESLSSHSPTVSSESSSVLVNTPFTTHTIVSNSESVTTQTVATPLSILPTSSDLVASSPSPLSTDQTHVSTSVFTSTRGSQIFITSTPVEETAIPTQLSSSIHHSSSAAFPGHYTASVPIHSTSSTVDKILPESTSLYIADVTSSVVHDVISTTSQSIATTPANETDAVDLVFVNHEFEMMFQGNCEPLVNDKMLLKAFWKELHEKIIRNLEYKHNSVKAGAIACNPLRISFTVYQIPMKYLKLISSSLKELVGAVNITVNVFGNMEHYQAVKLNMAPTVNADEPNATGLEEIDLIVIIAAGAFCFVLISAGLIICVREYYTRRRTRTFELANYQGEDFTLTRIPRPAVNYTDKNVDTRANGHSNGDPNDTERLMDSIHLRVNSNENGLMVGITGTLERQKAELDSSPPTSNAGSEHLQFPLVPKESESLQSQDNPIYYIDEQND